MLEAVKSDALSLLSMAQDQKSKYYNLFSALKEENQTLAGRVQKMQKVIKEKDELAKKVDRLEKVYTALIQKTEEKKEKELYTEREIAELKLRFKLIKDEKDKLQHRVLILTEQLQEVLMWHSNNNNLFCNL